ncbi:CRISPR-associated endonuclease Cas1 [uncultured Methanobrevibacter sp.]|uniref:CRISPR-associated endonuclease Cas1 n=1 Tax=uncultured Methanobrevibacter sp. TaxID=253161 RepID=UPI002628CA7C|nr:CRISPR-associated endonuclease Cas1 [uncultured Methanobrevibacter sp.]
MVKKRISFCGVYAAGFNSADCSPGKGSITFDALTLLAEHDIDCVSIDWKGHVNYRLSAPDRKNAIVKKEQYFSLMDSRSGYLAKAFILAKIENQKAVLGTLAKSRDENEFLINQRDKLSDSLEKLSKIYVKASDNLRNKIMGIEGQASVEYWAGFADVLDEKWNFNGRSGRGAQDPVNSLLNYGYAVVESEIWKSIYLAGLDPYCGFLHSERYGRASLVFDLIEEFRQQIVDKTILSIVNMNQVDTDDFEDKGNIMLMNDKSRRLVIAKILDKLNSKVEFNGNKMSYSDIIMYQGRQMAKFLTHEDQYVGFYRRW